MPGHVFLSYSHVDSDYVERLATYLTEAQIPVWFDTKLPSGERWTQFISEKINQCAAMAVVMTPEAERSNWVEIEILRAQFLNKPIMPLLLRGPCFFILSQLQYHLVSPKTMPDRAYVELLRAHVGAQGSSAPVVPHNLPRARDAVEAARRAWGPDDPRTIDARRALASQLFDAGDVAEAVHELRSVVFDQDRIFGPTHPESLRSRLLLARYLHTAKDFFEARWRLDDLVRDLAALRGPGHVDTLAPLRTLAQAIGDDGQPAEAAVLLADVATDSSAALGRDSPETLQTRHLRGHYLMEAGLWVEAISELRGVVAARSKLLSRSDPDTLESSHLLGQALGEHNELAEAIDILDDVVSRRRKVLGDRDSATLLSRLVYCDTLRRAGRKREAARQVRNLLADVVSTLGANHPYAVAANRIRDSL